MMQKKIKLILYIRAGAADTGPPLGTVLGNIGVSTVKFCKEFNEFTKELPNYFLLETKINIEEDKNFNYTIGLPPIGFIFFLLKKEENIKTKDGLFKLEYYIFLEDIIKLAKFKFPYLDLKRSIKIIKGSLNSSNIKIKI
jgi:large subunit ribosomal protein L11